MLSKLLQIKPKERTLYAFTQERPGDFILYMNSFENHHEFTYFPGGDRFKLSFEDFHQAIRKGILDPVEQLPEEIYMETQTYLLSCPEGLVTLDSDESTKN